MRWILGCLAVWGMLASGTPSHAAPSGRPQARTGAVRTKARTMTAAQRKEILQKLNLTPIQKEAMRSRRTAYRKKMAELKAQLEVKHIELDGEMEKSSPDKEKLQRLSEEIGKLQSQKINEETDARLDFEKILTPKQLEDWKSYKQEIHNKDSAEVMDVEDGSVEAH